MNYQEYFLSYANQINQYLDRFFLNKSKEAKSITPIVCDVWDEVKKFITGGKRIRGGLVKLGWECFKEPNNQLLVPISAAIELTHGAILIHDDVIDKSILRHSNPTIHEHYKKHHQKNYKKGEPIHYGQCMAITAGIIGYYQAVCLINESMFSDEIKVRVLNELASFMVKTGYGETLDIDLSCRAQIKESEILKIYHYKTAYYTLIGPLKIGGILSGVQEKELRKFDDFGIPTGIAFQIQDDILGIFGDEKELGKPVGDDIREGKNTLLYTQAIKRAKQTQAQELKKLWGKKDITLKQIERVRQIITDSGSLEFCQKKAQNLIKQGKNEIEKLTPKKEIQEVFRDLSDYIINRKF